MWFRIQFYPDLPPVTAVFARNGEVLFRAQDVGEMLGYKNRYHFLTYHSSFDFEPPRKDGGNDKTMKVMTVEKVLQKIEHARRKGKTGIRAEEFRSRWTDGRSANGLVPNYPIYDSKFPPLLRIEEGAEFRIQDWIATYRAVVMPFYGFLERLRPSADLDVPPSSVQSEYYYEPPETKSSDVPETGISDGDLPETKSSDGDLPETRMLDEDLPETRISDGDLPETKMFDEDLPETKMFDEDLPETRMFDEDLPETKMLDEDMRFPETKMFDVPVRDPRLREEGTGSSDPPDLEMNFQSFPPERIRMRIQDTVFEYVMMDLM